jgi:hypothetical protein
MSDTIPTRMIKLDDLLTVMKATSNLMQRQGSVCNDGVTRRELVKVKDILNDVLWGYGPFMEVTTGDATSA